MDKGSVALGGFMGAGKTTTGRALAARLRLPFFDTDELLEQRFGPIGEQFRAAGEPAFRERERELVADLVARQPWVLATGGGLWVDARNRAMLRQVASLVVLQVPFEVIQRRVQGGEGRPLWDGEIQDRFMRRQQAYEDADLIVHAAERSTEELVEEISRWLRP